MSYSEVIREIESKGIERIVIDKCEIAEKQHSKIKELETQLAIARTKQSLIMDDVEGIIDFAYKHKDTINIEHKDPNNLIIRTIKENTVYQLSRVISNGNLTIKWESYKCNKLKTPNKEE